MPVKSDRVSGSDRKNCRQPRNFQNLLVVKFDARGWAAAEVKEAGQDLARKSSLTLPHDLMLIHKQAGNQIFLRSQRT